MGTQQMFIGAEVPLDFTFNQPYFDGSEFIPEPAPSATTVGAFGGVTPTGGTGSYTYAWSILTGTASISGSSTSSTCEITAAVPKNNSRNGTIQCVVSDGVSSVTKSQVYGLQYTTDL